MKLLVLTDIHGRKSLFKELSNRITDIIDYIVIAGDLTHFDTKEKALEILESLYNVFKKPIYFVPGNCDNPELLNIDEVMDKPIYNIHCRIRSVKNYLFYGIGGSNITPFTTFIEWREDQIKSFIDKVDVINKSNKLIMVTHIPIYSVMDEVNGRNIGSKILRTFLEKYQPILWITGHLHEYSNYVKIGNTIVLNPGPFMFGYYALVTINAKIEIEINNIYG